MSAKSVDARVRYTKMMIRKSFIGLLKQKPIAKITIKEICELAGINRATFYAHYTDQYDLMDQIEDEFLTDITENLNLIDTNMPPTESLEALSGIFRYIRENSELCSLILSEKGNFVFQKRVMMVAQQKFMQGFPDRHLISPEDLEYLFVFVSVGSVGIIQKWMEDGMQRSDEDMARLIFSVPERHSERWTSERGKAFGQSGN